MARKTRSSKAVVDQSSDEESVVDTDFGAEEGVDEEPAEAEEGVEELALEGGDEDGEGSDGDEELPDPEPPPAKAPLSRAVAARKQADEDYADATSDPEFERRHFKERTMWKRALWNPFEDVEIARFPSGRVVVKALSKEKASYAPLQLEQSDLDDLVEMTDPGEGNPAPPPPREFVAGRYRLKKDAGCLQWKKRIRTHEDILELNDEDAEELRDLIEHVD